MTVITISRQLGSLGRNLGSQLASRLGYRLVYRELINQAALNAGVPDMALATIDEFGLLGIEPDEKNQRSYLQAVQDIIGKLAEEGNVIIVGRAGQVILRSHPSAFHLRVIAPLETRIQRIVAAQGVSQQAARAQIEDSDRYRTQYLRRFYHIEWDQPTHYHLVINTGKLSLETADEVVCRALQHRSGPTTFEETHRE
jgi:cytidylate kinase